MIRFRLRQSEGYIVDFEKQGGVVVQASLEKMRYWKQVMVQFNDVQKQMEAALDEGLKTHETILEASVENLSGKNVQPDPGPPMAVNEPEGIPHKSPIPVQQPQNAKQQRPVDMGPAAVQVNPFMRAETVLIPEDNSTKETVVYDSKGYQGSGRLNMNLPDASQLNGTTVQPTTGQPGTEVRQQTNQGQANGKGSKSRYYAAQQEAQQAEMGLKKS